MPKKTETVLTFAVKVILPIGGNASSFQQYIRDAIQSEGGNYEPEHPYFQLAEDSFIVKLIKKETNYA